MTVPINWTMCVPRWQRSQKRHGRWHSHTSMAINEEPATHSTMSQENDEMGAAGITQCGYMHGMEDIPFGELFIVGCNAAGSTASTIKVKEHTLYVVTVLA